MLVTVNTKLVACISFRNLALPSPLIAPDACTWYTATPSTVRLVRTMRSMGSSSPVPSCRRDMSSPSSSDACSTRVSSADVTPFCSLQGWEEGARSNERVFSFGQQCKGPLIKQHQARKCYHRFAAGTLPDPSTGLLTLQRWSPLRPCRPWMHLGRPWV